jgi:hypothetical protein
VTGASNIDSGVAFDLSVMRETRLIDDGKAVWLGPGATWSDVYAFLDPFNLTVSGGRVGHVGVGGYVLGGGFSWFANEKGWTCDSVLAFEAVTPDLEILTASAKENFDLFLALKGSLGAFGLVTGITMLTIPVTKIYGGAVSYDQEQRLPLFQALQKLNEDAELDLQSQGYLSIAWLQQYGRFSYNAYLVNTAANTAASIFTDFTFIPHSHSNLRPMTPGQSAAEIGAGNQLGFRRSRFVLTVKSSFEIMVTLDELFRDAAGAIVFGSEDLLAITLQPLTVPHLRAGKGKDIFPLHPDSDPLLMVSADIWWKDPQRDDYFERRLKHLQNSWADAIMKAEALEDWVYPNYAAGWQQPFSSLNAETRQSLQQVKRKYDPDDIWRQLVPGIWHI